MAHRGDEHRFQTVQFLEFGVGKFQLQGLFVQIIHEVHERRLVFLQFHTLVFNIRGTFRNAFLKFFIQGPDLTFRLFPFGDVLRRSPETANFIIHIPLGFPAGDDPLCCFGRIREFKVYLIAHARFHRPFFGNVQTSGAFSGIRLQVFDIIRRRHVGSDSVNRIVFIRPPDSIVDRVPFPASYMRQTLCFVQLRFPVEQRDLAGVQFFFRLPAGRGIAHYRHYPVQTVVFVPNGRSADLDGHPGTVASNQLKLGADDYRPLRDPREIRRGPRPVFWNDPIQSVEFPNIVFLIEPQEVKYFFRRENDFAALIHNAHAVG